MDTKLLNKYIAGDVLPEEKKEVARWLKESEEHREQLMQLRHIYDATVWNANLKEEKPEKKKTVTHYLRTSIKIAAVVAMLAFILHKEYQEYRLEHSTEMQVMTVPAGQRASLVLADGANWWKGERRNFLPRAEKYVNEKSIPQIQELVKKYDPDILWFDTPSKLPLYLNIRILEAIREVDRENKIVVNGRLVRFGSQNMGDYRNTGDRSAFFFPTKGAWESIPTTNESYGYSRVDTVRKSVPFFVQLLASAASKGGNILMNVGPMGNGQWDSKDIEVFQGVGKWLKVNGESIYGTRRTNLPIQPWGVTTLKGDTLYVHVYRWPADSKLIIGGLRSDIRKGWFLADKKASVQFKRLSTDDYELTVPAKAPDSINSVIALVLGKQKLPNPIRLLDAGTNVLYTFDAELQGRGLGYGDGKPNRNYVKNWKNESQSMKWRLRLNEPAEYTLYLDYNTAGKDDKGTVIVEINGKIFEANYPPYHERKGSSSIRIGKISLPEGAFECNLKGKQYQGNQYMNPIAVRLEK